jgi:hypothetical protein
MSLAESRIVLTEKTGDKKDIFYILKTIDELLACESALNKFTKFTHYRTTYLNDEWLDNKWVFKILVDNGYTIYRAGDGSSETAYIEKKLIQIGPVRRAT